MDRGCNMPNAFPGTGHKYLVDFQAFKVTLSFTSDTSLTYVVLNSDGSAGETETVVIKTENVAPDVYLVTWIQSDNTTVVHIEDYGRNTVITNITSPPPNFGFNQFHGTFQPADEAPAALTYSHDIRPLFRDMDITCMGPEASTSMIPRGCARPPTPNGCTTLCPRTGCLRTQRGRRNAWRCSSNGWTRA